MTTNPLIKQELARLFLQQNAVSLSLRPPFTWTSGLKSPIYCDCRTLTGYVEAREQVVQSLCAMIREMEPQPQVIAGTATAGIAWAALVAAELRLPMVYVRSSAKAHGKGQRIEGFMQLEQRVLIVEDLISTGKSSLETFTALSQEKQAVVVGVLSLMTYDLPIAQKNFAAAGIQTQSLITIEDIMKEAYDGGQLTDEDVESISTFLSDPQSWVPPVA